MNLDKRSYLYLSRPGGDLLAGGPVDGDGASQGVRARRLCGLAWEGGVRIAKNMGFFISDFLQYGIA